LIVDFKDNLMTWDNVVIAMKMYPKKPPLPNEPSIVSQVLLDMDFFQQTSRRNKGR
jgi:hypothetical protein